MHTKSFFFSLLATIAILSSCGGSSEQKNDEVTLYPVESTQSDESKNGEFFYISNQQNLSLAEIRKKDNELAVKIGSDTYFGEKKRDDKRKYFDQNNKFRYAVKYKDDAFKLRDSNEQLLWKVKIKEGKISIANNEEMTNPFTVRYYDEGRIKVEEGDKEINSIRFDRSADFINVGTNYNLRNFNNSFAAGVLMLPKISDTEKYLICAELVNMGK